MFFSRDHFHEGVSTLQFMEELIELLKGQLSIHCFPLVFLIEEIHLQMNETFTVALYHGISSRDYKLY